MIEDRAMSAAELDLLPHYDFSESRSLPNRFADRFPTDSFAVVLDPDVARVFRSADAVNGFLRAAIKAMPPTPAKKRRAL